MSVIPILRHPVGIGLDPRKQSGRFCHSLLRCRERPTAQRRRSRRPHGRKRHRLGRKAHWRRLRRLEHGSMLRLKRRARLPPSHVRRLGGWRRRRGQGYCGGCGPHPGRPHRGRLQPLSAAGRPLRRSAGARRRVRRVSRPRRREQAVLVVAAVAQRLSATPPAAPRGGLLPAARLGGQRRRRRGGGIPLLLRKRPHLAVRLASRRVRRARSRRGRRCSGGAVQLPVPAQRVGGLATSPPRMRCAAAQPPPWVGFRLPAARGRTRAGIGRRQPHGPCCPEWTHRPAGLRWQDGPAAEVRQSCWSAGRSCCTPRGRFCTAVRGRGALPLSACGQPGQRSPLERLVSRREGRPGRGRPRLLDSLADVVQPIPAVEGILSLQDQSALLELDLQLVSPKRCLRQRFTDRYRVGGGARSWLGASGEHASNCLSPISVVARISFSPYVFRLGFSRDSAYSNVVLESTNQRLDQ